jgi:hypothetical protein
MQINTFLLLPFLLESLPLDLCPHAAGLKIRKVAQNHSNFILQLLDLALVSVVQLRQLLLGLLELQAKKAYLLVFALQNRIKSSQFLRINFKLKSQLLVFAIFFLDSIPQIANNLFFLSAASKHQSLLDFAELLPKHLVLLP